MVTNEHELGLKADPLANTSVGEQESQLLDLQGCDISTNQYPNSTRALLDTTASNPRGRIGSGDSTTPRISRFMGGKLVIAGVAHIEKSETSKAFEAVLEVSFRKLPGHRKMKQREYALRNNALQRDVEKSLAFTRCFLPGKRIDMSMIFDGSIGGRSSCPACQLVTSKTEEGLDSQVQW